MVDSSSKKIEELESRISKLEKVVFHSSNSSKEFTENYEGLSGGLNFLISKNFLNSPKSAKNVMDELKKEGYFHSKESVDKALRVDFFNKKKILTRIKENNVWHYVIRK